MYFLYDLAQFRPNPPVHLLQEQLWHSLTSLPQKTCQQKIDPQTPSNHQWKGRKKTSENLRSLWRKALKRRFNKVSNSITDFFTRTKSPISGRHEFSEKNPWELWVNFQQAFRWGSLGNDVKIDYLQCTYVPQGTLSTHFGTNIYLTISYHLIFSAPERCWHCQKSVESLVHYPGNPEETQSPPRSSEMHVGPHVSLAQRTGNFDRLRGTSLKHLKWDDGTYGT